MSQQPEFSLRDIAILALWWHDPGSDYPRWIDTDETVLARTRYYCRGCCEYIEGVENEREAADLMGHRANCPTRVSRDVLAGGWAKKYSDEIDGE